MVPTTPKELSQLFDHTLLKADATSAQVKTLCQEAVRHQFFGVCVNSTYIQQVRDELGDSGVAPVAVVGFPLGAVCHEIKAAETKWCVAQGATEIDTVVQVGPYLEGREALVRDDIAAVVKAAGSVPVKVILETAYLNPEQIAELTVWSAEAGSRFVKTSTGFASRGASVEDVATMRAALEGIGMHDEVGIKASGGIRTLDFVKELAAAGATRIGASASVAIMQEFAD